MLCGIRGNPSRDARRVFPESIATRAPDKLEELNRRTQVLFTPCRMHGARYEGTKVSNAYRTYTLRHTDPYTDCRRMPMNRYLGSDLLLGKGTGAV